MPERDQSHGDVGQDVRHLAPWTPHAAIATRTAPEAGHPQSDRVLRRAGPVGRRIASSVVLTGCGRHPRSGGSGHRAGVAGGPARTARARRRPAPRRSATPATTGPDASTVARTHRGAAVEQAHDRAERTLGDPFGLVGVAGEPDGERDGFGRRPFQLADHQLSGVGRRPPVDLTPAVAGAVRTRAPGLARIRLHPVAASPASS